MLWIYCVLMHFATSTWNIVWDLESSQCWNTDLPPTCTHVLYWLWFYTIERIKKRRLSSAWEDKNWRCGNLSGGSVIYNTNKIQVRIIHSNCIIKQYVASDSRWNLCITCKWINKVTIKDSLDTIWYDSCFKLSSWAAAFKSNNQPVSQPMIVRRWRGTAFSAHSILIYEIVHAVLFDSATAYNSCHTWKEIRKVTKVRGNCGLCRSFT